MSDKLTDENHDSIGLQKVNSNMYRLPLTYTNRIQLL